MPVNKRHLNRMEKELTLHEQRIDELRKQIKLREDEIQAHSVIVGLGRNKKALATLDKLIDDPALIGEIKGRKGELQIEGVSLPDDSRIELRHENKKALGVDLFVRTGEYVFRIAWDDATGFS